MKVGWPGTCLDLSCNIATLTVLIRQENTVRQAGELVVEKTEALQLINGLIQFQTMKVLLDSEREVEG